MRKVSSLLGFVFCLLLLTPTTEAAQPDPWAVEPSLAAYFAAETAKLQDACLAEVHSLEDWEARRPEYRRQLLEMLGPGSAARTDGPEGHGHRSDRAGGLRGGKGPFPSRAQVSM